MVRGIHVQGMNLDQLLGREWLATNGVGGYASSTIPCLNTRKYHGLLVASMTPPVRRMVLLSRLEETIWRGGQRFPLDCNEYPGVIFPQGHLLLQEFQPGPPPTWTYTGDAWTLRKQLCLLPGQNTVVASYRLVEGDSIDLEVRPLLAQRTIHELNYQWNGRLLTENRGKQSHRVPPTSRTPEVFFAHDGQFFAAGNWYLNQIYRREQERGYAGLEDLWTPGVVRFKLTRGKSVHFVCSADPISFRKAIEAADASQDKPSAALSVDPVIETLRQAAGQFVVGAAVKPPADRAIVCIGGYPWFGPASREALIAFAGLLLVSGRFPEAKSLLTGLASKLRNGLLPSQFPEDGSPPVYHGADISLWFINALWHYLRYTGDEATGKNLLDVALQIIDAYRHGADLGVAADAEGLLASRAPSIPTTWMDAKVGDWVITPRGGRPVELNALWYNAVRTAAELCGRFGRTERVAPLRDLASSIEQAFNARFWNDPAGCCFDVVDDHGTDPSIRPNQLLAISLPFAVLSLERHQSVLDRIRSDLLTPMGIRTLAPADPGYQGRYEGNVVARDRACHNGSAFPWLLGHYVTALLKLRGRGDAARAEAHGLLRPCIDYLLADGMGQLCELFGGDLPHPPGGAITSATAVGELLRCYVEDILGVEPASTSPSAPSAPKAAEVPGESPVPHGL